MQSVIQDLIHKIGDFVWPVSIVSIILNNKDCAKTLFFENFLDPKCISLALSKSLGYLMMLGSCFYKVPIILKIVNSKGGSGLNIISVYLETSSYLAALFYNFFQGSPFSTYGDFVAPILQNCIIIGLIWFWGIDKKPFSLSHISIVILIIGIFTSVIFSIPQEKQNLIVTYSIIIMTISRLPQILSNFTTGNVGVQSPITLINGVIGAAAKTFITFVETKDIYLISGSALSLTLNIILLSQIVYLQHQESSKKHSSSNSSSSISHSSSSSSNTKKNKEKKI